MNSINYHPPLVSVIIPAYNAEAFIRKTLDSVLSQTYKDIEVLVVDDGSKDRTPEIVESFAKRDTRITLFQQSNQGVAAARNLAIEKSRGEYIAPIDADDIWYPEKLEKQVECMLESDPSVGLVYAWSVKIDENDSIIGLNSSRIYSEYLEGKVYTTLAYLNFLGCASTPLIRRTCFNKIGGYNCQLKERNAQGCEDWDIYLRIAEYYQFRLVPEFLIGYRQVIGSMAGNCIAMAKSFHLVMADVQQRHPEIPNYIYQWSTSHFYTYLFWKSYAGGDYLSSIFWLYETLKVDFTPLLCGRLYRQFLLCIIRIVAKPATSLIWRDHHSWLQFRKSLSPNRQEIKISDINSKINEQLKMSWKPYDRIWSQRLFKVVQCSQQI